MIARPSDCDVESLQMMLTDSLDVEQQMRVTQHLDTCEKCRERLEHLADAGAWWHDTREVLCELTELEVVSNSSGVSKTTFHSHSAGMAASPAGSKPDKFAAVQPNAILPYAIRPGSAEYAGDDHWVLDLLATSDDPEALGAVDGMPVHSVVGQGGMGVVLKARDESLHRFLAIKLLSPMLANTGAARQRFLREAQAAAAVVHPNIVPIYTVSTERKLPYLVMPFVAGGNLQQYLDEHGPLAVERVLSIGLQIAEGLSAAHRQGIVHRDIKPANLMLDEGGFRVMLTDFGLARALDDATLTGSGMVAGTPQFMSPEQAQGRNVDHRSDLYSLGCVLYALATGRPPVRGDSALDVIRRIGLEEPKPIIEINEAYPRWFQTLVAKLMVKDRAARIQSAEEVSGLFRACLAHARTPHQVSLPSELKSAGSGRNWFVIAATVMAACVLFAFALRWLPFGVTDGTPALLPTAGTSQTQQTSSLEGEPKQFSDGSIEWPARRRESTATLMLYGDSDPMLRWNASEVDALLLLSERQLESLQQEIGRVNASAKNPDGKR